MSAIFKERKARILKQLDVPESEYSDLSPKGSIDAGIRGLINEINDIPTLVTTSSCAGRVSVYLEGRKRNDADEDSETGIAGSGGKGGGKWLYVNHDPIDVLTLSPSPTVLSKGFGLVASQDGCTLLYSTSSQLIHFKFEAMILHILTASMEDANKLLTAASVSGFRESGAMGGLLPNKDGTSTPIVAIRCNGLALDSIIGYLDEEQKPRCLVSEEHLNLLVSISEERFRTNTERISRFREAVISTFSVPSHREQNAVEDKWEDAAARKVRKRAEGLVQQEAIRAQRILKEQHDTGF